MKSKNHHNEYVLTISFTHLFISQVEINRVTTLCKLLDSLLCGEKTKMDWKIEESKLHPIICTTFLFSYVWSMGGNLVEKSMESFENFVRDLFGETQDVKVNNNYNFT